MHFSLEASIDLQDAFRVIPGLIITHDDPGSMSPSYWMGTDPS